MVGVDQYGGDIEAIPANDFEECREKCNETPNCQRWTHQTSKEGACYLKYEDVEKEYRPNGDVAVCHHCKTGFQNSKDSQCGATGKAILTYTINICSIESILMFEIM